MSCENLARNSPWNFILYPIAIVSHKIRARNCAKRGWFQRDLPFFLARLRTWTSGELNCIIVSMAINQRTQLYHHFYGQHTTSLHYALHSLQQLRKNKKRIDKIPLCRESLNPALIFFPWLRVNLSFFRLLISLFEKKWRTEKRQRSEGERENERERERERIMWKQSETK